MFRIICSPVLQRQVAATRSIATSRSLFTFLQPTKKPLTSLNNAAAQANLDINGTLEETAAHRFSEASTFPDFSPTEDTLLAEAVPRIKTPEPVIDAHSIAAEGLAGEMQQHFCQSSDFPEYTPAEEEAVLTNFSKAATQAGMNLNGTLKETAARHFSESSVPDFSPTEDTLISEVLPRNETTKPIMDAHSMAAEELTGEMQQHFCQSSDFPEYTPAEEEAVLTSLSKSATQAGMNLNGTLNETATRHFSEASVPDFSPTEDTLIAEVLPRNETTKPIMDAHGMAAEELTGEMQQHFCQSSDFPERTPAEEEAMLQTHV